MEEKKSRGRPKGYKMSEESKAKMALTRAANKMKKAELELELARIEDWN